MSDISGILEVVALGLSLLVAGAVILGGMGKKSDFDAPLRDYNEPRI